MIDSESTTEGLDSWARIIRWSTWTLAASLVAAAILFLLVEFGAIEGSGPPPGTPEDYPTQLGYYFADQRVVFPYEIAAALLFSLGFLALAGVGLGLRGLTGTRNPWGTIVAFGFSFAAGLMAVSELVFIGAKRVAIDPAVCECKYAPEQLISQDRTLDMVSGVTDWLVAGALLLAGLGMLAIPRLAAGSTVLTDSWAQVSRMLGFVFLLGVLGIVFEVDVLFQLVAGAGSLLLLPAWALWLDRQLRRTSPTSAST